MKKAIVIIFILMLVASVSCVHTGDVKATSDAAPAAEEPSPMYWIGIDEVIPAMAKEYEAAVKDLLELYAKHGVSFPVNVYVGASSKYAFNIPLQKYASIDKVMAEYRSLLQKESEISKAILRRIGNATNGGDRWISESRPELSYTPDDPRLKPEDAPYNYVYFIYTKHGYEDEVEALLKSAVDIHKKYKIQDGFGVGAATTGSNLPFYTIGSSAKDALDYRKAEAETLSLMGAEYKAMVDGIRAYERSREVMEFTLRPDLSYIPK